MVTITPRPRPSILIECGPRLVGTADPGRGAKTLIAKVRQEHNLNLKVLVYAREEKLAHNNFHVGGRYVDTDNVEALYRALNAQGLPFNLALNGSPIDSRHVPFSLAELQYLGQLQASGFRAGLRNAVTVADNALVPALRKDFPELDVVASCISAAFEPNLVNFRNSSGVAYEDPQFLLKYYSQLYSSYDMVVPLPQLTIPAFFGALSVPEKEIARKTILFMSLGCGSPQIGRCLEHYEGKRDCVRLHLPIIPQSLLVKPEDRQARPEQLDCSQASAPLKLMNRFGDLRALWSMGINQFKIPARTRSLETESVFGFLCSFIAHNEAAVSFTASAAARGYTPAQIKLSFRRSYPSLVHRVLQDFSWPKEDAGNGLSAYCGHTAACIQDDLHARAYSLWGMLREGVT